MTKDELKAFRESKGLHQSQFAEWLGLERWKTISEWENGHKTVPAWAVKRIEAEKEIDRLKLAATGQSPEQI